MREGTATNTRKRRRACQHRWVIETPHGATSRGLCKRCGATKRFPNAAEDALWDVGGSLGRWANRGAVARPSKITSGGSRTS
jgi:hypothetical protein